jgi:hypothetical protein
LDRFLVLLKDLILRSWKKCHFHVLAVLDAFPAQAHLLLLLTVEAQEDHVRQVTFPALGLLAWEVVAQVFEHEPLDAEIATAI